MNESDKDVEEEVDNVEENNFEDESLEKAFRCDYGYCDLKQNVYIKTRSDLKAHLKCHHGIE